MTGGAKSPADPPLPTALISPSLKDQIETEAARGYPNEICGLLLGSVEGSRYRIERLFAAANVDDSNPRRRFRLGADEYLKAEVLCSAEGLKIIGVYHSHPDAPPLPSATDTDFAFPGWVYWITPVQSGAPGAPRAWLRDADLKGWREVAVRCE